MPNSNAQKPEWKLWAEGLPQGVYPRMVVAPNHDIFYGLLGAGTNLGAIYKANTQQSSGSFAPLPAVPRPSSVQNNIVALGYNIDNEALVGIYRTDMSQAWFFRLDQSSNQWDPAESTIVPSLGGHCMVTDPKGIIYVGTRWAYIYKSLDGGRTFEVIDDSKSVKAGYPCYYPTALNASELNGAIFSLNIDQNGRIYAGTETAGVIYSDDEGVSWHPADLLACSANDPLQKDTSSPMFALSISGNVAALGFTKENHLVWSGANMWDLGWKNKLGFADFNNQIILEAKGFEDYSILTGQQISKIVTTKNGRLFLHSGSSSANAAIGIYTSLDGIHWELCNQGITGVNDGLSQGSLTVDGNMVFMATRDGKVFKYHDTLTVLNDKSVQNEITQLQVKMSKENELLLIDFNDDFRTEIWRTNVYSIEGKCMLNQFWKQKGPIEISIAHLHQGFYWLVIHTQSRVYNFPFQKW